MGKGNILICFGMGNEIPELFKKCDDLLNENYFWWCKNVSTKKTLLSILPDSNYLLNSVHTNKRRLTTAIDDSGLPFLINEWKKDVLRYEEEKAQRSRNQIPLRLSQYATLMLCEAIRTITIIRPEIILIKAATRIEEASFKLVANHLEIPILFTERGAFPFTLFLDEKNVGAELLRTKNSKINVIRKSEMKENIEKYLIQYRQSITSSWEQPDRIDISDLRKRYLLQKDEEIVFFAGQVEDDANMLLYSPFFKTNSEFLEFIAKGISFLGKKMLILVKPHPKEKKEITYNFSAAGVRVIVDRQINIKDAITLSNRVVTINSTTGFESLLFQKPVIVGGKAHYSHRGFTFDISNPLNFEELRKYLLVPSMPKEYVIESQNYIFDVLQNSIYFQENDFNLNGPNDYIKRILDYKRISDYEIPNELIQFSNRMLQDYSYNNDISIKTVKEIFGYGLNRIKSKILSTR